MHSDNKIKILLVDDHKIIRQGLRSLLDKESSVQVIAETDNGRDALKLCRKRLPDVVIMDVTMQDMNGIEATRYINEEHTDIKVIGLSVHSDRQFIKGMLQAGALGYLLKDCSFREILNAIHTVNRNQTYLSPKIAGQIVESYLDPSKGVGTSLLATLTPREREVLQLLAEGNVRSKIADTLCLSPRTIETHRRNIMDKLNINNTAELVKFAIREKLTSLES